MQVALHKLCPSDVKLDPAQLCDLARAEISAGRHAWAQDMAAGRVTSSLPHFLFDRLEKLKKLAVEERRSMFLCTRDGIVDGIVD